MDASSTERMDGIEGRDESSPRASSVELTHFSKSLFWRGVQIPLAVDSMNTGVSAWMLLMLIILASSAKGSCPGRKGPMGQLGINKNVNVLRKQIRGGKIVWSIFLGEGVEGKSNSKS